MSLNTDIFQLSILQIQALVYVNTKREATMSEIAKHFNIELPSASSLITKLFVKKLISRDSDQQDRRLVKITLTKKGELLLLKATEERRKKIRKMLSYLSEDEILHLRNIVNTLSTNFNNK
jgi:DNA-binding MarR family transcriptional regulator